MHALPSYPRNPLAAGLLVLALALAAMAATAPDLGSLDLSVGGGSTSADTYVDPAATSAGTGTPAWASDPLAPPVEALR